LKIYDKNLDEFIVIISLSTDIDTIYY